MAALSRTTVFCFKRTCYTVIGKATMTNYSSIDSMTEIRSILRQLSDEGQLTVFGNAASSDAAVTRLQSEIDAIIEMGHDLSLIMIDLKTKSGVSFDSERIMCYQSTIKAIYVGSLLDDKPEAFTEHQEVIRKTIELSDNDTYKYLRDKYGDEPLIKWCRDCGIDDGFADKHYPRNRCAKELCILWTRMFTYLESGKASKELKSYLSNSACSSARETLSSRCFVQSKAGWENGLSEDAFYSEDLVYPDHLTDKDPSNDECAINDSGVIHTQKGPYLFVIFSDIPYGIYRNGTPSNPLNGITEALYRFQQSL